MTRRVVLDTNIIVTGFGRGGVPGLVLDVAFDGRFVAVASVALLREVQDVIRRSEFAEQFPYPEALIDRLTRTSRVTDLPPTATILGDEDDNRLIDAARAGDADIVVTGDLLVLDADPIGSSRPRTRRRGAAAITPIAPSPRSLPRTVAREPVARYLGACSVSGACARRRVGRGQLRPPVEDEPS